MLGIINVESVALVWKSTFLFVVTREECCFIVRSQNMFSIIAAIVVSKELHCIMLVVIAIICQSYRHYNGVLLYLVCCMSDILFCFVVWLIYLCFLFPLEAPLCVRFWLRYRCHQPISIPHQ